MKGIDSKIIITMLELMEQMDVSDKTVHRMIEDGDLPNFTYGSRTSKKKGWHSSVLELHAINKYNSSQSIKHASNSRNVIAEDMGITLFRGRNRSMSH